MKVLVAGGGGYVGTRLCNEMANEGHQITAVDLFWFGNHLNSNVRAVKKDLIDLTRDEVSGYDAVVFLAGLSNDPMANFSPKRNFIENAAAPSYLSFISKEVGIPRFVYASSCSVYGFTDNKVMTEDSQVNPQYPYGISKLQAEYSLMNLQDESFRPISMRKGTVGGWSPRMRFDLVVNTMTKFALTQGKIVVHNPNLWRPLIDIRDVVEYYKKAIMSDLGVTGVFNICGENYTIGKLAEDVEQELSENGIDIEVEIQKRPDVRNYLASNEKAKKLLGFEPLYGPRESIREVLKEIKANNLDLSNKRFYNIQTFMELENATE
jgi:nucleoside-diphosphate-sugar epimerase